MAPARSRIRKAFHSLSLGRSKDKAIGVDYQSESPLFKLPFELREQIWQLALAPRKFTPSPHFHVYDTVYDSCTYDWPRYPRKDLHQMSLLLTCRAIYNESVHFLYRDTDFTLVLFAGRARPDDNLSGRNCIGAVRSCEQLFSRMKKVTLVVQPGKRPETEKYVARLAELLRTMNYCQGVKNLTLHFNFHNTFLSYEGGEERFNAILRAFYPLEKRHGNLIIQACALWGSLNPTERFNELQASIPGSVLLPWCHIERHNQCLVRGIVGSPVDYRERSEMTRREKAVDTATLVGVTAAYVVLLPVSLPITFYGLRKRKLNKGER